LQKINQDNEEDTTVSCPHDDCSGDELWQKERE
jgi:hypothetical protein